MRRSTYSTRRKEKRTKSPSRSHETPEVGLVDFRDPTAEVATANATERGVFGERAGRHQTIDTVWQWTDNPTELIQRQGLMKFVVLKVGRQTKLGDGHGSYRRSRFSLLTIGVVAGLLMASRVAAQTESTNATGYFNSSYQPGYALIAVHLDTEPNTVDQVIASPPEGTQLLKLESQGWRTNVYNGGGSGWTFPEMTLAPGEAAVLQSPEEWIQLWAGRVWEGEFDIVIPAGGSLRGNPVPQAGRLSEALQFPKVVGTRIYRVDNVTGEFLLRATCTEVGWEPEDPLLQLGEGFYVEAPVEFVWTRVLKFDVEISRDDQGRGVLVTAERIPGRNPTLEVSSDLVEWTELEDAEPVDENSVLDRSTAHQAARFYRVRVD